MAKRNRKSVLMERKEHQEERGRVVKSKFMDEHLERRKPINPLNEKQARYMDLINHKNLVIATGYAGTSKTYLPTAIACEKFINGDINKIILIRPNVSNSPSLGMFKGTLVEKITPWLAPVLSVLKERLGSARLELAIEKENICFVPLEVVKGMNFENCFVIVDEAEDLCFDDAKKILTRQGKNCKMVMAGDIRQSELKENSGLRKIMEIASKHKINDVGCIDFDEYGDIVRSRIVKDWVIAFEKEGV